MFHVMLNLKKVTWHFINTNQGIVFKELNQFKELTLLYMVQEYTLPYLCSNNKKAHDLLKKYINIIVVLTFRIRIYLKAWSPF